LQRQIRFGGTWTRTIGWLIGINVAVFVLQNLPIMIAGMPLTEALGLIPGRIWPLYLHTLVTYAFLHGSVGHIFFNMLTLYFFGGDLDLFLGTRRFLILYFGSALTGGIAAALFLKGPVLVVGASGALYGLLAAYALYFPETTVLLWFVLPMKIWVLVLIWVGLSVFYSVFGSGGGIAHLAHLGGALFGFAYVVRLWKPSLLWSDLRYRWRRRRFHRIQ
jgi:membrane associated rhomboid family serine protease